VKNGKLINQLLVKEIEVYFKNINLNFLKNCTILITGSSGFIGSQITLALISLSIKKKLDLNLIITFRDKNKILKKFGKYKNKNIKFYEIKKNKPINLNKKIDKFIHCASYASPTKYNDKFLDVYDANINLTINLCELAKRNKNSELIYISSSEIYGLVKNRKIDEGDFGKIDPLKTRSSYALSKKIAENILANYLNKYKVKVKIIRLFHTIGWNEDINDGRLFFHLVKNFLSKNKVININSHGKNQRAYCHILDVIQAIFLISKKGKNGEAYNVGNPENIASILELIKVFKKKTFIKKKIIYAKNNVDNYSYIENKNYFPNTKKIKKLGWKPKYNIEQCIEKIWYYYLKLR
jgi:UDP-glucuronate decarboxylase